MTEKISKLPETQQEAFLSHALYTKFEISDIVGSEQIKFFMGGGTLDAWCPKCQKNSVFNIPSTIPEYSTDKKIDSIPDVINIEAVCGRGGPNKYFGCDSALTIVFQKINSIVIKIGQYPSTADLDFGALDNSFKELSEDLRKELGSAIGLFSHGVGIGSFVYLRRIFESLVEDAYKEALSIDSNIKEKFKQSRMEEKIALLPEYLPSRLIKSAQLYAFLSKGIHELSEDACKEKFPLLKQAIQLILKEKFENKQYDRLIKEVEKPNPVSK